MSWTHGSPRKFSGDSFSGLVTVLEGSWGVKGTCAGDSELCTAGSRGVCLGAELWEMRAPDCRRPFRWQDVSREWDGWSPCFRTSRFGCSLLATLRDVTLWGQRSKLAHLSEFCH